MMQEESEKVAPTNAQILTPTEFVDKYILFGRNQLVTGGSIQNPAFTPSETNFKLLEAWAGKKLFLNIDGRNVIEWLVNPQNLEELKTLLNRPETTYNLQNAPFPWGWYWPYPLGRNHIKAFVVFGEYGFTPITYLGGYNLGPDEWLTRHDYMIKITDLEIAQTLAALAFKRQSKPKTDEVIHTNMGSFILDNGQLNKSTIYNTAVSMGGGSALPEDKIICISPWSPGNHLQQALLHAQKMGCNITYATNIPPLELNGYSIYNVPKYASRIACKVPLTPIRTEIHGKLVAVKRNGIIVQVLYTGHCLTDYQKLVGTTDWGLYCEGTQVIPGTNEFVESVLNDRIL